MMKKHRILAKAAFLLVSSLPLVSVADDFDGSKPLTCAAIFSAQCTAVDQSCVTGAPWMINIPVFMQVDFDAKKVTTTRQYQDTRTSNIRHVEKMESGHTAIQGVESTFAWSMLIAAETGTMTLSITGPETGFLVFGACLPGK